MKSLNKEQKIYIAIGIIALIIIIAAGCYFYKTSVSEPKGEEQTEQQKSELEKLQGGVESKTEKNIDESKNQSGDIMSCKTDADCGVRMDTCNCRLVCRNTVDFTYKDDCNKACTIQEMDITTQDCKCENNKCVKKAVQYFDTNTPVQQ